MNRYPEAPNHQLKVGEQVYQTFIMNNRHYLLGPYKIVEAIKCGTGRKYRLENVQFPVHYTKLVPFHWIKENPVV